MRDDQETRVLPRLASGTLLARRYRLAGELGRGGMGVVFRARDEQLGRDVAVKVLPDASSSPESRVRLLREARAAAALNHTGIVAVHDVGEHEGIPFFVMELVAGSDLHHRAPRDLPEIVRLAVAICDALEHAHAHGVVHRDLKPENILLSGTTSSPAVKLADLGVAVHDRASHRITSSGEIVGTVSYMAPEQALGEAVDGRADLYALGVVLYELVTGRLPFTGARPLEVVSQHVHAPVVPPRAHRPNLPRALDALIVRLLAKQPGQRFADASETRAALKRALSDPETVLPEETTAATVLLEALSRGKLVGRAGELAEARELWRRARDGQGHCLLLSGEPGAGKTRLARELLIQGALDGALVLTGACYEYEAATPYLPFAEAFRRYVADERDDAALRTALGDAAPRLARLAPEIASRLGPFPETQELPPHEERLLFVDAVASMLRTAARSRGVLFYFDDLHWADASTLWMLGHLLRGLRQERVLFAASYRELELDRAHPLSAALVDWNRERLTTRIALKRFALDQTREQLETLLCCAVSPDFAEAVQRETEGNPFFVEEVLKALIERGSIRRERGQWTRDERVELEIPQSVKAAIGHRLDRVSPECSEVLRAAAVLGKTFEFDELLAVAGERGEDVLLDAVDAAVGAQLLTAGRDTSFAFTHDKIREVLYEELNPIRRRRLHRRTAEGLQAFAEKRAVPAEKLAHHFVEAGDHERGLYWARRAGADAQALLAYDEAITAYRRAADCAQALGRTGEQAELEEAAGKTSMMSGNLIAAAEHFERALALTEDPVARARLQTQAAASLVTNGDPRGLAYVHEALAVLDPVAHAVETATALSIEGRFHHLSGRHRKAADLLERAARLATPPADGSPLSTLHAATLVQVHAYTAAAYQHQGLFEEADRWAEKAITFGERQSLLWAQAVGYEFLGENAWGTGAWEAGLEYAEKERVLAARLHSRERRAWTYIVTGTCNLLLGRVERGAEELTTGLALAEAIGERRLALLLRPFVAVSQARLGDLPLGLRTATEALERADASHLPYMRTEARRCLGELLVADGRPEEGLRRFEEVLELTAGTDARVSRLWTGPPHVETLLALGRPEEAAEVFRAYAAMVAECQSPWFRSEVERLRPRL
ncbi:MAG TPA: protein kinase [Candidatus Polarisedimenticolaceae bacterium]|nr:protein kinase [Candidatus Polarisedimenticolaceae bacterium]